LHTCAQQLQLSLCVVRAVLHRLHLRLRLLKSCLRSFQARIQLCNARLRSGALALRLRLCIAAGAHGRLHLALRLRHHRNDFSRRLLRLISDSTNPAFGSEAAVLYALQALQQQLQLRRAAGSATTTSATVRARHGRSRTRALVQRRATSCAALPR
jgi:hypothetical protein